MACVAHEMAWLVVCVRRRARAERRVPLVSREGDRWAERDFEGGEVDIRQPEVRFDVADMYAGIDLDPA